MLRLRDASTVTVLAWALALAGVVALGVHLRLADPLSTSVVPAEDPYTHMALVREHLDDGRFDPLHEDGQVYPPGMHALVATAWTFTGLELYDLARFLPVAFGAAGIAGVAVLLARLEGPVAAIVGSFAVATAPEAVFRTTMLAPTALDLALLPFLLLSLVLVIQGRYRWVAPAAVLALFLAFSHPWLYGILGLAGPVFILIALLFGWPQRYGPTPDPRGVGAAAAIVVSTTALAVAGCWGACGPGFQAVVGLETARTLAQVANVVLAGSLALGAVAAFAPHLLERVVPRALDEGPDPARTSRTIALVLLAVTLPAMWVGFPRFVEVAMAGWPLIVGAAVGLVALPYLRGPATFLGAAIVVATYPFVIYNPLDSPFWPHRTAVYLGVGLALLAGVMVGRLGWRLSERFEANRPERAFTAVPMAALLPLAIVGVALASAWAATPDATEAHWYRMYEPCEMDGLREVAELAEDDESLILITGNWRSKLVLAALAPNVTRTWYKADLFTSAEERSAFLGWAADTELPLVVVVDHHTPVDHPDADLSFVDAADWTELGSWSCGPPDRLPLSAHAFTPNR